VRPEANDRRLDQGVHYAVWPERGQTDHRFEVIRLWQQPMEPLLAGGLGTLPLAPLCQPFSGTLVENLPGIIRRIDERLSREAAPAEAAKLWAATFVLAGLRLPSELVLPLFQGVHGMKESSTYQYILEEGRAEEARKILRRLGQKRLGPPGEAEAAALEGLRDLDRLERLTERVDEMSSWQELLDTP
jgi:hypothetical protein